MTVMSATHDDLRTSQADCLATYIFRCSISVTRGHLTKNMSFSVPNDGDFFLGKP